MKFVILAVALVIGFYQSSLLAQTEGLEFHVGCYARSLDCVEFEFLSDPTKKILASKNSELTVAASQVTEASIGESEYGIPEMKMQFDNTAGEKFEKLTGANAGKMLVMVANGKALVEASIQQAIPNGRFALSLGQSKDRIDLEQIPWLAKMTQRNKASEIWSRWISVAVYIFLGTLVLGGSIYFAFVRTRPRS